MGSLMLGLMFSALPLLVLGGVIAGFGQGLSFRAALAAVNASAPAEARGEVASSFFVAMYIAISLPVIGEGVLAETTGLRAAGVTFAAVIAAAAAVVLGLARRVPTPGARTGPSPGPGELVLPGIAGSGCRLARNRWWRRCRPGGRCGMVRVTPTSSFPEGSKDD